MTRTCNLYRTHNPKIIQCQATAPKITVQRDAFPRFPRVVYWICIYTHPSPQPTIWKSAKKLLYVFTMPFALLLHMFRLHHPIPPCISRPKTTPFMQSTLTGVKSRLTTIMIYATLRYEKKQNTNKHLYKMPHFIKDNRRSNASSIPNSSPKAL